MRQRQLLHKVFVNASICIDKRIHKTLLFAASTLAICRQLSLYGLGRHLDSPAKVRHNIKRIDRLLGNKTLQQQPLTYYRVMAHRLIAQHQRPLIIVDWSPLSPCGRYHLLRAALPVGGRTLTMIDKVYPESHYGSQKAHREFIDILSAILPANTKPIIITDAGFRAHWFKRVLSKGWDFIGRVRHHTYYQTQDNMPWNPVKSLYSRATHKAQYLFDGVLTKVHTLPCRFYLIKKTKRHRLKKTRKGQRVQSSASMKHEAAANEPWLVATSLTKTSMTPKQVIHCYSKRMQIEEGFRDLKSSRHGFGFRQARTGQPKRLEVMLLIANLAFFLLWIAGLMAKQTKVHYDFQANSIKHRHVLSVMSIGWQYLKRKRYRLNYKLFKYTLNQVASHVVS